MNLPPSLRSAELEALWQALRSRLEARGLDNRGRIPVPPLSARGRQTLSALVGRKPGKTVAMADIETGLVRLHVGDDLAGALAALGHPVSQEPIRRRAERGEQRRAHEAARAETAAWTETWASAWIDEVIRAGTLRRLTAEQACELVRQVRAVLDRLAQARPEPVSRTDLAAQLLGSAHALDSGTRLEAAVARALRHHVGAAAHRELWAQAGVHLDLISAPALTWRLTLHESCGLAGLTAEATRAGVPIHLSRMAMEQHPVQVAPSARILVVENPRVVEAAAQTGARTPMVATNGQPSSTVQLLLQQLADSGADLRYHGDFDAAGLAICERMTKLGLTPWRMGAADYRAALAAADADGTRLPLETQTPGPTSWDHELRALFERERRVVHQERLLAELIALR